MSGLDELFTEAATAPLPRLPLERGSFWADVAAGQHWVVEGAARVEYLERDVPSLLRLLEADGKGSGSWTS